MVDRYAQQPGTVPASAIPSMNRTVRKPALLCTAAMLAATMPQLCSGEGRGVAEGEEGLGWHAEPCRLLQPLTKAGWIAPD
jgi:hypothetical protein